MRTRGIPSTSGYRSAEQPPNAEESGQQRRNLWLMKSLQQTQSQTSGSGIPIVFGMTTLLSLVHLLKYAALDPRCKGDPTYPEQNSESIHTSSPFNSILLYRHPRRSTALRSSSFVDLFVTQAPFVGLAPRSKQHDYYFINHHGTHYGTFIEHVEHIFSISSKPRTAKC